MPDNDTEITGATTKTNIGNVGDRLKVDVSSSVSSVVAPMISRQDVSTTATASGNSGTLDSAGFGCLSYELRITAASGTTPLFQLNLEVSDDATNWFIFTNTRRFSTADSSRHQRIALGGRYYRYSWVISGTTPSFTFTVQTTLKDYLPNRHVAVSNYADININAVDNVSAIFQGADCENICLITTRSDDGGSSTQYKVEASNSGASGNVGWSTITGAIAQGRDTTVLTEFAPKGCRFYRLKITSAANVSNTLDVYWAAN